MPADLTLLLTGIALSQIALALVKLSLNKAQSSAETVYIFLLVAVTCHLINQIVRVDSELLSIFFDFIRTGTPGLFWLLCSTLFIDDYKIKPWHISLVFLTMLMPTVMSLIEVQSASGVWLENWLPVLLREVPQVAEFCLLGFGLWIVISSFQEDLIKQRRRLRVVVFGFSGVLIFSSIFERQVVHLNSEWFDVAHLGVSALYLFVFNLLSLRWQNVVFSVPTRTPTEAVVESNLPVIDPSLVKLKELMQEQYFYQNHSLTIGQLADVVGIAPHRLRGLINGELGFRNFSEFLNGYRIEEAASRLQSEDTPILNIALDVGFRSLTSFNKVFKTKYRQTPSDYRKSIKIE